MELLSKHRKELLAVGMIWLALFHSYLPFHFKSFSFVINACGYGGVDIFMFLSGFGIYFSYKKDSNYLSYIKRRLLRILPYNIILCIVMMFVYDRTLLETVLDALGLSIYFRGNLVNWYTSLILTLYVLSPLYLKIFNKKPELVTGVGIALIFVICRLNDSYHFVYIWFRSAIYLLGMYFGYALDKEKNIHEWFWIILSIIGWVLMYCLYHYYRNDYQHVYPLLLITPGLCLIFAHIFDKISIFDGFLSYISKYSYQFYMIHLIVRDVLYNYYGDIYNALNIGCFDIVFNIAIIIIAFLISVLLTFIINSLERRFIKQ